MRARGLSSRPRVIVSYRLRLWVACVLFVFACLCLYHKSHSQRLFCGGARVAWGSKANWTGLVTFQLTLNRFISFCVVLNRFVTFQLTLNRLSCRFISFCVVLNHFVTFHIVRIWVTKSIRAVRLIKHSAFVVSYGLTRPLVSYRFVTVHRSL